MKPILSVLLFLTLISCEKIDGAGNLAAFKTCVDEINTEFISGDSIRASCARRVQKEILPYNEDDIVGGSAGFSTYNNSIFNGNLENTSGKYIFTDF